MSDDLITSLRALAADLARASAADVSVAVDAMIEIERLREALKSIARNTCCGGCQEAARVARKALEAKP